MSIKVNAVITLSPNVGTPNVDYPLPDATVGVLYSTDITAAGGTPPYAWAIVGALPPGLIATPANAPDFDTLTISGTPTTEALALDFDVVATDALLATGHQQY